MIPHIQEANGKERQIYNKIFQVPFYPYFNNIYSVLFTSNSFSSTINLSELSVISTALYPIYDLYKSIFKSTFKNKRIIMSLDLNLVPRDSKVHKSRN